MPLSAKHPRLSLRSFPKSGLAVAIAMAAMPLALTAAQAQAPPAGSGNTAISLTGWNANIINSAANTTGAQKFDYANAYGYYANGFNGNYSGLLSDGTANFDGNSYQMQSYTSNNVLYLATNSAAQAAYGLSTTGTLALSTPTKYQTLSILATSANASSTSAGTVTLNFSDGTTDSYSYSAPDWFNTGTGQFAKSAAIQRTQTNAPTSVVGSPFGITESRITLSAADAAKVVNSMTFSSPTNAAETAIFAVSGYNGTTPTPTTTSFLSVGSGNFTSASSFIINGTTSNNTSAYIKQLNATTSVLRLTDGTTSEASSAFASSKVSVNGPFKASFTFAMSGTADGLTFILQGNNPYNVGSAGGSLGYSGNSAFNNSVGIALNAYSTSGTALVTDGTIGTYAATSSLNTGSLITANLAYDGSGNLTETLINTSTGVSFYTTTYTGVNIASLVGGNSAYIGFTGGTGGLAMTQDIYGFSFLSTPEPATLALMPIGLMGVVGMIRRRRKA